MTTTLQFNELQQYSLASRFNFVDYAARLQPIVASRFVEFCDSYLTDFLSKFRVQVGGEATSMELVKQLVKQFAKLKDDRITQSERENKSLEDQEKTVLDSDKKLLEQQKQSLDDFAKDKKRLEQQNQSLQSQVDSLAKDKKLLEQQKQSLLDSSANDKKSFEQQKQSLQSQVKSFQDAIDSENALRASRTFDSRYDTMVRILKCCQSKYRTQPNLRELLN
jgi:DNA repair exonuclease SbcCD ATPase subunit